MDDPTLEGARKFRTLTFCMIGSGALNIALGSYLLFQSFQEREVSFSLPQRKSSVEESSFSNEELFAGMSRLSYRELLSYLTNQDCAEEGYAKRDFALAALTHFYHFNLDKALGSSPLQKRTFLYEGDKVQVYPGLSEAQFQSIIRYAYQEKWPLTSQGLFLAMQKIKPQREPLLEEAFCHTEEFGMLESLFQQTQVFQPPSVLVQLTSEGNWDVLERFVREQQHMMDGSVEKRRRLLLSYLALQSPTAAQLLLETDFSFCLRRLSDRGILDLIALLHQDTQESRTFCRELLTSLRSDPVWKGAASKLYEYEGETPEEPLDMQLAIARFVGSSFAKLSSLAPPQEEPAMKVHVVKEGESLWKIARQYQLKVDQIVQLNDLEKETLYPGMTLRLPQGTGSTPPE